MKRFRNILVCINLEDQEHPALDAAIELAHNNKASLRIVLVQEELPTWTRALLPAKLKDWEVVVAQELKSRLDTLLNTLNVEGIPISSSVLVGKPFVELIREVLNNSHDLLVKDLEPNSAMENSAIGSTDMHLLRKCPAPVWLIKPRTIKRFERILAAVEAISDEEEDANSLNTKILELATSLAIQEQCKLFVVRAYESIGEAFVATDIDSRDYAEYLEHIQMVQLKNDQRFIGKFKEHVGQFDARFVFGDPGSIIPQVAREEQVDLIVMGTVARPGIPGLLIGRTAETVLRQVECSVLGVKPRGFVSPFV